MTPRNVVAAELATLIGELQQQLLRAEALAQSSGLVRPHWFRGAQTAMAMAAGDLDQKGLLAKQQTTPQVPA